MRSFLITSFVVFLFSCNSSKKDPNQAMDDTARMRNPPVKPAMAIEPVKITAAEIPAEINVKGKVQEALKWNDELGENILVTSSVDPYDDKNKEQGEDGKTAELYAYHFAKKDGQFIEVWSLFDAEKSCPFDITCGFIPGSATVTDLDKDGIAETKVQYSLACRSDVSPANMKLMMYENGVKYGLKGLMWLAYSPGMKFTVTENDANYEKVPKVMDDTKNMLNSFGRYENEKEFAEAPVEFINFARKEWVKHVMEKMGD